VLQRELIRLNSELEREKDSTVVKRILDPSSFEVDQKPKIKKELVSPQWAAIMGANLASKVGEKQVNQGLTFAQFSKLQFNTQCSLPYSAAHVFEYLSGTKLVLDRKAPLTPVPELVMDMVFLSKKE
jgi:hypothetical protein